ncbi:cyclin-like protein interacting with PHO85, partial [Oleoguttula sp. CCFEE 5521]
MGSVVLDAVNTFFGQSPSYTHPSYRDATPHRAREATTSTSPPPSKRSRTPSKGAQPPSMSQRATSASATRSVPRGDARATSGQRQSQSRGTPRQPAEPDLGGNAEVPTDAPLPGPAKDADVPRPTRQKIKVRDLEHIQSFASDDAGSFSEIRSRSRSRSSGGTADESPQYEISGMKVEHIIEMVAGLLTKITSTNDRQHEHLHGQPTIPSNMSHLNPQTTSVLAFHGKNVPSITILSYLSRINKYCPTSYEVFLSLLVYFDRMTERVNAGPMQSLRDANAEESKKQRTPQGSSDSLPSVSEPMEGVVQPAAQESTQTATPPASGSLERAVQRDVPGTPHSRPQQPDSPPDASMSPLTDQYNL